MVSFAAIAAFGLLGSIAPWIYGRYEALAVMYMNRPGHLPSMNAFQTYQVLYEDTVRNCEDAVIDEASGFALLSCDPGRDNWNTVMGKFIDSKSVQGDIYIYHYARAGYEGGSLVRKLSRSGFPADRDFHPLGMNYHKSSGKLFVVNHALPAGIEVFTTSLAVDQLTYESTFTHPSIYSPNSIQAISDHELLVTNDHYMLAHTSIIASQIETYLAPPGGSVNYVNLKTNEVKLLARIPFANGVALLNATHVAVASSSTVAIRVFEWDSVNKSLTQRLRIKTPFYPDNLKVDSKGNLLVAGHPFPPSLDVVMQTNHEFALDGADATKKPGSERPRSPSAAMAWNGNPEGQLQTLYVGSDYDAGCTAVRDVKRKTGILTGLYGKGILLWKE